MDACLSCRRFMQAQPSSVPLRHQHSAMDGHGCPMMPPRAVSWDPAPNRTVVKNRATATRRCRVDALGRLCEPGIGCRTCVRRRYADVEGACPGGGGDDAARAKAVEDAFCRVARR